MYQVTSIDQPNIGYSFPGTGAVAVDDVGSVTGGVVYAYSNVTNSVRIWHPVGVNATLVHIKGMADDWKNQLSSSGIVNIKLWKGKYGCDRVHIPRKGTKKFKYNRGS